MPSVAAAANVTMGFMWAPDCGPKARISAVSAPPVAIALASKARPTLPPHSCSAMMPEPTTAISRKAVATSSIKASRTTGRIRFSSSPRFRGGAAGGSATGLCYGLLGHSFGEGRLAAHGALTRLPELRERSLAIDRGLAVSEKRLPRHPLRVGNPLLVGLGITADGGLCLDDRPLGP